MLVMLLVLALSVWGLAACSRTDLRTNAEETEETTKSDDNTDAATDDTPSNAATDDVDAAHVHALTCTEAVSPTCTEAGNSAYWYCVACGKYFADAAGETEIIRADTVITATGHTEDDMEKEHIVAATCTEAGSYDAVVYCAVCGVELSRENITVAALAHNYEFACFVWNGYTAKAKYVCANDDSHVVYYDAEVSAEVTTPATYGSDGVLTYTAAYDVYTDTKTEVVAALQYNLTFDGIVWAEDYTAAARYVDGDYSVNYDAYMSYAVTTEPSCEDDGEGVYTATYVGEDGTHTDTLTVILPAKGHTLTYTEAVGATCTEDGNTAYYTCIDCEKYFADAAGTTEITHADTVVAAMGHAMTYFVATAATCTEAGSSAYYYCTACGKYYADEAGENEITIADAVIAATGHTYDEDDWHAAVATTCEEAGSFGYYVCSVCGYYIDAEGNEIGDSADDLVIDALGHTYGNLIEGYAADCENTGRVDYYKCLNCYLCFVLTDGEYVQTAEADLVIAATGHSYGSFVAASDATCTATGNVAYCTCSVCGKYFDESYAEIDRNDIVVAALGHNYVDGTCTRCGATMGSLTITTEDGAYDYADTDGYEVYTITTAGSYYIEGACANGQLYVAATDADKVYLFLNGVEITNRHDAAIYAAGADKLYIVAVAGTDNYVTDARVAGNTYTDTASAAIYAACDLNITQDSGKLTVVTSYNSGIHCKKDMTIKKVDLSVTAVGYAIKGEKSVDIASGTVYVVSTSGDGIKTEDTDLSSKGKQRGTVTIEGGTVYVYAYSDGIDAAYNAEITGDGTTVYIYTANYATSKIGAYTADGGSAKGIKANNDVVITGATVEIQSTEDGIHANAGTIFESEAVGTGNITLSAATVTVITADDGIVAEGALEIASGNVTVTANDNGIVGATVYVADGNDNVYSKAGDGVKSTEADLTIAGGTINIYAAYDGISSAASVQLDGAAYITVYTNKYSTYTDADVDTNAYIGVYSSYYSSSYAYAVLYYNSDSDYVWADVTYKGYKTESNKTYYYYSFDRNADYTYFYVYRFTAGSEYSSSTYNAVSGKLTTSKLTSNNLYTFTSVSNKSISGSFGSYSYASTKGIKSYDEINVNVATLYIKSYDDAIHANNDAGSGNVTISGGALTLYADDDAVHADNMLTINGGTVNVTYAHEGLEGYLIYINDGTLTIYATDDGINAAGSGTPWLYINGGTIDITMSSGDVDGIDSNGNFTQTGGTVITRAPVTDTSGNMSGLDIDGKWYATGGNFVCAGPTSAVSQLSTSTAYYVTFSAGSSSMGGGMGGMGGRPGGGSSSSSTKYSFAVGTWYVKNSSGTVLFSFTLNTTYTGMTIYSSQFVKGSTYTLTNGTTTYTWTQSALAGTVNS